VLIAAVFLPNVERQSPQRNVQDALGLSVVAGKPFIRAQSSTTISVTVSIPIYGKRPKAKRYARCLFQGN
jgi:hypothetical protein